MMRLLDENPETNILIYISKKGFVKEKIKITNANLFEVEIFLKNILSDTELPIIIGENSTRVLIQKSKRIGKETFSSFSFKGLDPLELKDLILNNLPK